MSPQELDDLLASESAGAPNASIVERETARQDRRLAREGTGAGVAEGPAAAAQGAIPLGGSTRD